jgi:hypothetical protein
MLTGRNWREIHLYLEKKLCSFRYREKSMFRFLHEMQTPLSSKQLKEDSPEDIGVAGR